MGSGGSKNKPKVENKTNNSGPNNGGSSESSYPQPTVSPTAVQRQVPPQDEKLPSISTKPSDTDSRSQQELSPKDPVKLPSLTDSKPETQTEGRVDPKPEIKEKTKTINTKGSDSGKEDGGKMMDQENETKVPEVEEKVILEDPVDQKKFDCALRSACLLVKPDSIYKHVTKNVTKLQLSRALPHHFSLEILLNKLDNLQDLDLSHNNMGPQGFRAICLAMCGNSTILSLNLADNKSDTDSADCLGRMVEENKTLQYLDISSNYLGKDYFSRRVGPALKVNTSLQTLRCESIGTTDAKLLIEGLQGNTTLVELDLSQNELSDKAGFAKGLTECLKRENCSLRTLCLTRCGFNTAAITELMAGLAGNRSVEELNLSGSEFANLDVLLRLVITAACHPCLHNLSLDNSSVKSTNISTDIQICDRVSALNILSLNSCGLNDAFFTSLLKSCEGKLLSLVEVDIASNENLSVACIRDLVKMTSTADEPSSLRKISYGLNKADDIPDVLGSSGLQNLTYLSLRMCRISSETVGQLAKCWEDPKSSLSTLVLDGLKLSGTSALKSLLSNPKTCKLTALSLGGCQLDDNDLSTLIEALKGNLPLHMLKLSANRITDVGVASLADGLLKNKAAQISVLDLSNNRITDDGVKSIVKLFGSKSKLNSLNVSSNSIGKDGLVQLSGLMNGKSSLQSLHAQGQTSGLDEPHMIEIYTKLASSLGYKIQTEGDQVKPGCSDLPSTLPERLLVNFTNLGGQTGSIGQALDSPCIQTDQPGERLPYLSLQHIFTICCYLKGQKADLCVWSERDWDMITGADRPTTDAPSWLKLPDARGRCIYMCNLPGNTTQQKVDAILEMEADCNLDEACLMKDPVTRNVNGCGWALMVDAESIQKALDLFNNGEAKVFGQPFMISEVKIKVDNEASSLLEKTAAIYKYKPISTKLGHNEYEHRPQMSLIMGQVIPDEADRETRLRERAKEEASHRSLIVSTTEASWKRHAYRLAHPAYADGRIW